MATNLDKVREKTQFKSGEKAVEAGRKGGIASGEAKRRKVNLKRTMETLLSNDYSVKNKDGTSSKLTGEEAICMALFRIAMNPKDKQCVNAYKTILHTIGQDIVEEGNGEISNEVRERVNVLISSIQKSKKTKKRKEKTVLN